MTPSLFAAVAAIPSLTAAFHKVRRNGGGPGGDGETIAAFERAGEARLARLAYELEAGLYRPGPLRRVAVPKRSGGTRILAIPCVVDRIAQAAAAGLLSDLLEKEFEPTSFAYRPGRSARQAVARVAMLRRQGWNFVVDGDIRAFFDEVPHAPLLGKLRAHVEDPRFLDLIGLWLASFSGEGRGLAQGSPISPVLSNLHLDALDEAFGDGPVRIVRFADDFVLLARNRPGAEAGLARAAGLLAEHGLALNLDKTRIVPFEQAFEFLGHLFVRSIEIEKHAEEDAAEAQAVLAPLPSPPLEALRPTAPEVQAAPEPFRLIETAPRDELASLAADRDAEDFAAGLAPLYVLEPGRVLETVRETFVVREGEKKLVAIPARLVGRIDLGPQAEARDDALRLAAAHAIPVAFLDGLGAPQAVLTPADSGEAALRLAQAGAALDLERARALARAFAAARIRNAHALLKRLNRRRRDEKIDKTCDAMFRLRRRAEHAADIDAARGFEGEAASLYWPALGRCLQHDFFIKMRREDVAANPVNIALDATASLLTRDMRAAVLRAGLHPGIGALHASADLRDACVYDLVEAFRAPLSEGLVVYLFNNRILGPNDFLTGEKGLRMSGAGSRKLYSSYETWLARPVKNARTGRHTAWRSMLLAEARAFAAALRAGEPFAPYALDY